jgi:hypothetical protein
MCSKNKAMKTSAKIYPDLSDILALKQEGWREISRRSFAAKIAMVEAVREQLAPLKRFRELRKTNASKRIIIVEGRIDAPDGRSGEAAARRE